jgi:ATP adenylyltransferase
MDYLWTPWRYQYITGQVKPGVCVFCAAAESSDDKSHLVVHRGTSAYVILNRFPYTSGHLMVVPKAHVASLLELPDQVLSELMQLARDAEKHLRAIYRPQGLNLGMNLGESAGAGIAGHLHLHALPRWTGDTSFITVVSETRVLPEDLEVTWQRMREAWRGVPSPGRE